MLKLTLYFDSERVRKNFLNDFSGLIVWHDRQQDEEHRVYYEDVVTFAVPDLEGYDSSDPDSISNQMTADQASAAIDPSHPIHWLRRHELLKKTSSNQ
jgi:hypothetical protein